MPSNATRLTWNSGEGKQRPVNKAFVLSIYLKLPKNKLNSYLENSISFSVIYRFIGLRDEVSEICSINRKHRSNWTVTLSNHWGVLVARKFASCFCQLNRILIRAAQSGGWSCDVPTTKWTCTRGCESWLVNLPPHMRLATLVSTSLHISDPKKLYPLCPFSEQT